MGRGGRCAYVWRITTTPRARGGAFSPPFPPRRGRRKNKPRGPTRRPTPSFPGGPLFQGPRRGAPSCRARVVVPAAIALIAGAAGGISAHLPPRIIVWLLPLLAGAAAVAWWRRLGRVVCALLLMAFSAAGITLGSLVRDAALDTTLRRVLDREFGGFAVDATTLPGQHTPIASRFTLAEDASTDANGTTLRADVIALHVRNEWRPVEGAVVISVGGAPNEPRAAGWRRGRTLEAPVTFRRPARYLDEGVPDF